MAVEGEGVQEQEQRTGSFKTHAKMVCPPLLVLRADLGSPRSAA